ncbi:MAG: hypothetical protein JXA20_20150 [Spirochaetes bacterium]|nr:hypothetical protein [Spirochaetota bacterium]
MRDDIRALFATLLPLYRQKHLHLTQMLQNEREIAFSLKSENTDRALALIDNDDASIDEIDHLDALIASARDSIAATAGIDRDRFDEFFAETRDSTVLEILDLCGLIRSILSELAGERERVCSLLSASLKSTGKNIEELSRIERIRRLLKKT